jgi:site-specific DNA-methyltransferase (adenine-specific)
MDCIEGMKEVETGSVDMILCDLPYGVSSCKWDAIIPFDSLWEQYERVIKDNGAIVLTATQPFTTSLISSNLKLFRYEWIWQKTLATNFMFVKKQPAKKHENICVFYRKQPAYTPQMEEGEPYVSKRSGRTLRKESYRDVYTDRADIYNKGTRYPSTIQKFSNGNNKNIHPTQKPVPLFEYLIKTYTVEGETVLDNCMGSGTTAIACLNTNRNYIGFELDKGYHDLSITRLEQHKRRNINE